MCGKLDELQICLDLNLHYMHMTLGKRATNNADFIYSFLY